MKLGIIGYENHQGLGVMNEDLLRIFDFNAHLIIPSDDKGACTFNKRAKLTKKAANWQPTDSEVDWLLSNSDVVVTIETDFNCHLFEKAKARGVKTIFIIMSEWFDHTQYKDASVFLCTAKNGYDFVKFPNKVLAAWPVDTDKFKFKLRGDNSKHFLHNAGYGGLKFRKGTIESVGAFHLTKNQAPDIMLEVNSQRPASFWGSDFERIIESDKRIKFKHQNVEDGSTLYENGDCYLYPARYDGQALVAEEAMACGFPVFVTDAPPMNEFSDDERFKLKLASDTPFKVQDHFVNLNLVNLDNFANKILWASMNDLTNVSRRNRQIIEEEHSWNVWKYKYGAILNSK